MKPSKLRLIVAWYLDLLLLSAIAYVIFAFLKVSWNQWYFMPIFWIMYEVAVWKFYVKSFGYYAMGIILDQNGQRIVDPQLKNTAHWVVLLFGVFQFYAGHRIFSEGIVDYQTYYLLGLHLERPESQIFLGSLGMLCMLSSIGLFRCKIYGPVFVIGLQLFSIVNDLVSFPLLREVAEEAIVRGVARRGGRTISLTAGDLAWIEVTANILYLIIFVVVSVTFRKRFYFKGIF